MKRQILIAIILASITNTLFARIGETFEQCKARYGQPIQPIKSWDFVPFRKGQFLIAASFYEGHADLIVIRKVDQDILGNAKDLSTNEIEQILKANGGDLVWKNKKRISLNSQWQTENGEYSAEYQNMDHVLTIATQGRIDRENAKKKAQEDQGLRGF